MGRLVLRRVYVVWAWIIAVAVVVQVFLAGMYVFGISSIAAHAINGSFLLLATLLGGIFALIARVPGRDIGMSWALFGLVILQVVLIEVGNLPGLQILKAFHPVNALVIFGIASMLVVRSRAYFAAPARAATVATPATPAPAH